MGLQNCEICKSQFKWSKIYKSLCAAYRPIQCSQCELNHRITFSSRILLALLTVLPIMIFGSYFLNKWSLSISYIALIMIIYGMFLSVFFPYLVKYSSDN
ncbi:TIGR04104 family putative zinc finger protein [Psychrobacillus sp. NPDC093180]|uniref:TIGR04104 family putative zinc finger protein n=1 Tax=Psychrobacillus sp. NPDC093180 TaxID=3364489 RepID=UPI00382E35E9